MVLMLLYPFSFHFSLEKYFVPQKNWWWYLLVLVKFQVLRAHQPSNFPVVLGLNHNDMVSFGSLQHVDLTVHEKVVWCLLLVFVRFPGHDH